MGSTEEAPSGSPTATEQPAVIPAGESLIGDLLSIDLNAPPAAAPPPPAAPSAAVDLLGGGLDTLVSIFYKSVVHEILQIVYIFCWMLLL